MERADIGYRHSGSAVSEREHCKLGVSEREKPTRMVDLEGLGINRESGKEQVDKPIKNIHCQV